MQTKQNRGSALISVLLFLILLAVIAGAIMKLTKVNAISGATRLNIYTLQYAAEGGINRTIYELINASQKSLDESHGREMSYDINSASVRVLIENEAGKIDINQADETTLRSALEWAGEVEGEAKGIAQKIIDWRDEGSTRMPYGAEASDYAVGGYDYFPRNSNFQTVGELMQVMSVSRTQFICLAPYLTVYSGLALPVRKHSTEAVNNIMDLRENNEAASTGLLRQQAGGANRVFSLKATATKGDYSVSLRAVIRVTGNARNPYYVHLWRLVDNNSDGNCIKNKS